MSEARARIASLSRKLRLHHRLGLRVQLVTINSLLAGIVAIGLVAVVQISLANAAAGSAEQVLNDRAIALVQGIDASSPGTSLNVPTAQLNPGVVVYDAKGTEVAGTVPPSMREVFGELSASQTARNLAIRDRYSILVKPFLTRAGVRGVVVITEPLDPYERGEQAALVVSIVAGVLLILVAAVSAFWISRRVLLPVERMARTADDWSEHELDRRFSLGPSTNEIKALANTLDRLLDKVATVIKAEQRLTSELAHELRSPLTTIRGTAELLAMRQDLDTETQQDLVMVINACDSMANTIAVLLEIARRESHVTARERTRLADLRRAFGQLPLVAGGLEVNLPENLYLDVPIALAIRAVAPVVENALHASDEVVVEASQDGNRIAIVVADRGPGIPDDWLSTLFTPGWSRTGGSGLGLSLARRVARSGGGDVTLAEQHNTSGGASFVIAFPGGTSRT